MFPTSPLYKIHSELVKYATEMQRNTPNNITDEQYEDLMIKFTNTVNNFLSIVIDLDNYNGKHHSNYNPNYGNDIPEENVKSYEDTLR